MKTTRSWCKNKKKKFRDITLKTGHIVRHFTKNRTEREIGITKSRTYIQPAIFYLVQDRELSITLVQRARYQAR